MSFSNTDRLQFVDMLVREQHISKKDVLNAVEYGIETAFKKKYGNEYNIKVIMDEKSGNIQIFRIRKVVEQVENFFDQISLQNAKIIDKNVEINGEIAEKLSLMDFNRTDIDNAELATTQKLSEAKKERQYNEFKDRVGEISSGFVKRVDAKRIDVFLSNHMNMNSTADEGVLLKSSLVGNEIFEVGNKIKFVIESVKRDNKGAQIYLSRSNNDFLAKLFKEEVPEIFDNLIQIKAVARDPGSRAKIAVYTEDNSIDAVGSCVGIRGSRVQAVINELKGEKIDIILWSSDPAKFVINALTPAEVSKVVIDEYKNRIEVIVPADNLSIAIGRRGQNVRLASQLTSWRIDVLTEEEESKRRFEEFNNISKKFVAELKIEEMMANLLVTEGFTDSIEVAYADINMLANIGGFDEEIAKQLQERAKNFVKTVEENNMRELNKLGVDKKFIYDLGIDTNLALALAEIGCKTLEDLADISLEELKQEIKYTEIDENELDQLIIKARNLIIDK